MKHAGGKIKFWKFSSAPGRGVGGGCVRKTEFQDLCSTSKKINCFGLGAICKLGSSNLTLFPLFSAKITILPIYHVIMNGFIPNHLGNVT